MSRVKRQEVEEKANELGLFVSPWNPGDGLTRYRFYPVKVNPYSMDPLGVALGAKQAMIWLDGFEAGYKSGQEA